MAHPQIKASIQVALQAKYFKYGFFIELDIQPPLLSKLNILNLGFFNSLQCHAIEFKLGIDPKAIVKAVTSAFKSYSIATLE